MDFSKFKMTPRHEQIAYLLRCDGCGDESWFSVDLPSLDDRRGEKGLATHHRPLGCGGSYAKIAEGYEHNDPAAWAARAAQRAPR